ncbi:hypothetical protein D049_2686 [Vibrio parahaemolyticus VPTS-2010]|nr:hypothetical protein D049_2686 [Vibrio parahaemolyticus VPTS-2010]
MKNNKTEQLALSVALVHLKINQFKKPLWRLQLFPLAKLS